MGDVRAAVAAEFPGWAITERWSAAGSGPDGWSLVARRGGVTLSAPTASGLRRQLRDAGG
jgi:hypothetical protein